MNDLTKEERTIAASSNWGLFHVYDLAKQRWTMNVLPVNFNGDVNADKAMRFVMERAKKNDSLALKALKLMAQFNAGKAKR